MERRKFSEPQLNTVEGLSAKLIELNHKLVVAEKERTQMLENISHDLRAPLTAIRSAVDLLTDAEGLKTMPEEELNNILRLLDARTKTLEILVSDLYYLTSLDNENNKFELEEVPLAAFLEDYFISVEIDEKYKERELILNIEESEYDIVLIDTGRMIRVLDNLFTNALKYSNKGDTIEAGVYRKEDKLVLYVKDTGIGIEKEKLPKIFDRMFMVSDSRTPSKVSGSGLGLSIVKGIIEKHGGLIRCDSEIGQGTCFTITLPIFHS